MHVARSWCLSRAFLRRWADFSWADLGCRFVLRSLGQVWLADWGLEGGRGYWGDYSVYVGAGGE
eukprot:14958081-Alexandrium_andersonii.AAC.1